MTKEEIFSQSLKELQNSRFEKILESKNYVKSTYSNKEILNLANKLGELKILLAKANDNKVKDEINLTKRELLNKLTENGYDINKIFPKFNCPICEDKGIIEDEKVCSCLKTIYLDNLLLHSQTNLDKFPLLDDIDLTKYSDIDSKNLLIKTLKKFIGNKNPKINTILFTGKTGTGKTFIAKSFLKTLILDNNYGLFYDINSLNKTFLDAHLDYEGRDKILNDIYNCDVLVIDDLGSENIYKNVTKEYLLALLNIRQSNNKLTLFTTNFTLNDIQNTYNERFFSRLLDKEISFTYNFVGKDLRLN